MPETVAAGLRLAPDALTRPFEPSQFAFKTTDEQDRNVYIAHADASMPILSTHELARNDG